MHQFDVRDGEDAATAWRVGAAAEPSQADRVSATLINSAQNWGDTSSEIPLYSNAFGGLVLAPEFLSAGGGLLCSFDIDGGTDERRCEGTASTCVPGCGGYQAPNTPPQWCDAHDLPSFHASKEACGASRCCAWRPEQLKQMLQAQRADPQSSADDAPSRRDEDAWAQFRYNEVVVDRRAFEARLPHAIVAVFYVASPAAEDCVSSNWWVRREKLFGFCEEFTRAAYAQLLAHGGVSPSEIPLVRLDINNWEQPFSLA